jgi:elongation of very long chain fatty acids protein 4
MFDHVASRYAFYLSKADPRVEDWPLMKTPLTMSLINLVYVLLAVYAPRVLKGRTISVYYPVLAYNLFMIILNTYMAYEMYATTRHYKWICQEMDWSDDETSMRTASVMWLYVISKFIEMGDTVFFICKGNYRQLSFLHIYHHSTMSAWMWIGGKWMPGGNMVAAALLNCVIHVIMYTYYFLAAFGPRFRKYLWWKKYMTSMQLTQFVFIIFHTAGVIWGISNGCDWPIWTPLVLISYMCTYIVLFGHFYVVNYMQKKSPGKSVANGKSVGNGIQENKIE